MQNNLQQTLDPTYLIPQCIQQTIPAITINSRNNEKVLEISSEGDVYFKLNGEFKKIECENDISLMFVAVVSELTGFNYKDKNELISKIIKNYRENQIDNILK